MISVIATIKIAAGKRAEFLSYFNANIPAVRAETGCVEYFSAIDTPTGIPIQAMDDNEVVVIEKWASVAALQDHLVAPHMQEYKVKVADLVESVSLRVLADASSD